MSLFLLGAILSAALVYAFYWRAQRDAARLEEEKQALLEERQIVIDYMHTMVDAVASGCRARSCSSALCTRRS